MVNLAPSANVAMTVSSGRSGMVDAAAGAAGVCAKAHRQASSDRNMAFMSGMFADSSVYHGSLLRTLNGSDAAERFGFGIAPRRASTGPGGVLSRGCRQLCGG